MGVTESLFERDDGRFVPTEHTRGPWDAGHQHGGPSAALVARACEREVGDDHAVTRLTLDLMQPIPLEPLTVHSELTRPGKRVRTVSVTVTAGETPVVRAHGLAIRMADLPTDGAAEDLRAARLAPGPDYGTPPEPFGVAEGEPAFHRSGVELRVVSGAFTEAGPAQAWLRLRLPVVAGERPTGLQRMAAAADFSNGLSSVLGIDHWSYVNPDLTVHFARQPSGEWIGLDALTLPSDDGTGLAEAVLYDRSGRVGRAVQSLILDRWAERPSE